MSSYKPMPKGPTGSATMTGPTVSFNQDAKRADDLAALAERRAAGDISQLEYVDPRTVMNAALMTGTGVKTVSSAPPSGRALYSNEASANYTPDPNAPSFANYFGGFINDAPSTAVPSSYVPSSYVLAPPPSGASRPKRNADDLMKFGGGTHRGLCKSKKGGKKGSRRSVSGKRCRRKAMRSRRASRARSAMFTR